MTIQTFTAGQTLTAAQMNTLQASDFNFTRNVQAGTAYTLVVTDKGKLLEFENTGSITLTIPANAGAAFDIGDRVDVLLTSTGTLSIVGDSGVTLNAEGDLTTISSQWTRVTLIKRGTDTWVLTGGNAEVQTVELEDGVVTEAKLATGAVTSSKIANDTIVNTDISTSAGIAISKLASATAGQLIVANSSGVPTYTTISGDITISDAGVAAITANAVALGTDTTGNYVASLVAGTGITLTNNSGESATPTIAVTAGTYQPLDTELTALASTTSAADALPYFTGSGTASTTTLTSAARSVLDDTTTAAMRTTLGVGTTDSPSFAGVTADSVQIGVTAAAEIDTASGNLTIDSAGGTTTIDDNVLITGTLTVSGSVTTVNTSELQVSDTFITVNSDVTGSPTENAGLEVERGTSNNVYVRWNETDDKWQITNDGTTYGNIVSTADSGTVSSAMIANNAVTLGTQTTGNYMSGIVAGTGLTVTHTAGEGSSASVALTGYEFTTASGAYSIALLDNQKIIECTGSVAVDVTVPPASSVAFPNGYETTVFQRGTGKIRILAGSGVTILSTPGVYLRAQYSGATLVRRDTNVWFLFGDLSAT